jgi:hypothetical protein
MSLFLTVVHNMRKANRRQRIWNFLLCRKGSSAVNPHSSDGGSVVMAGGEVWEGAVCEVEVPGLEHRGKKGDDARAAPALPGVAGS